MTDLKDTPEETDSTSWIICPWCFHKHRAPGMDTVYWEIDPEQCASCGKRFEVRTTLTFHAKPVMEDKPKEDLSGVNSPLNWKWTNPTETE